MSGEEVKRILAAHGITQRELAASLGTSPQNIGSQLSKEDVRTGLLEDISRVTGIPLQDFLIGPKGAVKFTKQDAEPNTVPLLPIFAQAGSLSGWSEGVEEVECERVISPAKDIDMAVHIYGESMSPDIPNGAVCYVRRITGRVIDYGRAYILDTVDGPVVKYLMPGSDDEHVRCISANKDPMFAEYEVQKSDILGIYRVVMCMKMM